MGLISRVSSRTYRHNKMVRVKRRHILFRLASSSQALPSPKSLDLTNHDIYNSIKKICYQIHGTIGGAKCMQGFKVKYVNVYTGIGYMSSLHQYHKKLLSALNFVTSVGNVSTTFHTLHISGTIKSCQKYLIKYHRSAFEKMCNDFSGLSTEQKQAIENSIKAEI